MKWIREKKIINVLKLKSPSELSHRLVLKSPESSMFFQFPAFQSFVQHQKKITSRFKNIAYPVIDSDCLGLVVKLGNTVELESGGRRDPQPNRTGQHLKFLSGQIDQGHARF